MAEDSFGRWIHRRRRALDLTQDELARQVVCSVSAIRKLEADERRPSKPIAARLAIALQIAPENHAAFITFARTEPYLNTSPPPRAPSELPPLSLPPRRSATLPTPLTRLIGRDQDVAAARNALLRDDTRLLTLIGPPGIGKTRLSLAVAHDVQATFRDGASFVALAPISDPTLVLATIAQAFGIKETAGQPLLDQLVAVLQGQRRLLLLDNFEQVLAAAALVAALLEACPGVKALITSRAALHVRGEQLYPVPALLLPNLTRLPTPSALAHTPAVVLFVERAQAVLPAFQLTAQNAAAVAAICVRLDGLPLAIELAATRITLLPPEALLARLEQRLALLTDGARDLPPRHQTLRAAIAWSYDLLDARAQTLFRRLGVFVGGWTLGAAEAVCGDRETSEQQDTENDPVLSSYLTVSLPVLDGLAMLVDTSLLRRTEDEEREPHFTMLETIRAYALERLEQSGEAAVLRRRHADYYVALAETAERHMRGAQQRDWLVRLDAEHDNLRAAIQWSLTAIDAPNYPLRLAGALGTFWCARGYYTEGRAQLQRALLPAQAASAAVRAQALGWAARMADTSDSDYAPALAEASLALYGTLDDQRGIAFALETQARITFYRGDMEAAHERFAVALAQWRTVGDTGHIADVLNLFGIYLNRRGNMEQAATLFQESLALSRRLHYLGGVAMALYGLGDVRYRQNAYGQARIHFLEGLALVRELDDQDGRAWIVGALGELARAEGQYAEATRWYTEALALGHKRGDRQDIAGDLASLGYVALGQGNNGQALAYFEESLALALTLGLKRVLANCIAGLAAIAAGQGQPKQAARLLGATEALYRLEKMQKTIIDRPEHDRIIKQVQSHLDDATFTAAWAEGLAMTREQAIAAVQHRMALERPSSHSPPQMA